MFLKNERRPLPLHVQLSLIIPQSGQKSGFSMDLFKGVELYKFRECHRKIMIIKAGLDISREE